MMKLGVHKHEIFNFWKKCNQKSIGFLIKNCIKKCNQTIAQRGQPTRAPKLSQPFTIIGLLVLQNSRKLFSNILKKQYFLLICLGFEGIPDQRDPGTYRDPPGPQVPFQPYLNTFKGLLGAPKRPKSNCGEGGGVHPLINIY